MPKVNPNRLLIDKHDIVGKSFGKWTVIDYKGDGYYNCKCSCGTDGIKKAHEVMLMRTSQCFRCRIKERKKLNTGQFKYVDVEEINE